MAPDTTNLAGAPAAPPRKRLTPGSSEAQLVRSATYASVSVAVTLIVTKFIVWQFTNSVSLLGSLLDSSLDVMASLISFFAVRQALIPPDREHRFGHGKAEALAALGQALFVGASALGLFWSAGGRIISPQRVTEPWWAVAVMVLSLALTLGLVRFQRYVIARTGSLAVSADSLHYTTDVLINGSILVALGAVAGLGWTLLDPMLAIAVSVYLVYSAWRITRVSMDHLMDREFSDDVRKEIRDIVASHASVKSMHDLRTRSAGMHKFIQFHLELDGNLTLLQAHRIADEVEKLVQNRFPDADILIHEDPVGVREERAKFA